MIIILIRYEVDFGALISKREQASC